MHIQKRVELILGGRYSAAEVEPPVLELGDYAIIARDIRDRAGRPTDWGDPRCVALRLGYRLRPSPVNNCGGAASGAGVLLYRFSHDRRIRGTRVAHELMHGELEKVCAEATEADAVLLTAEFLVPSRLVLPWGVSRLVAVQQHAYIWLIEAQARAVELAQFVA